MYETKFPSQSREAIEEKMGSGLEFWVPILQCQLCLCSVVIWTSHSLCLSFPFWADVEESLQE